MFLKQKYQPINPCHTNSVTTKRKRDFWENLLPRKKNSVSSTNIDSLPEELLEIIFSFLTPHY